MVWDELKRQAEGENKHDRDRWIGVWIGVLAVLLAICSMGGGNAAKTGTVKHIEAANTWAFFQAKNMRRHTIRLQAEEFEALLQAEPQIAATARQSIESKIKTYRDVDKELTSKPETGEGLDELWAKGKALEKERDVAFQKDPYFDYGEAFLQIAIVLASIAIIAGGNTLLFGSFILAGFGAFLTLNGFTLAVAVPFLS